MQWKRKCRCTTGSERTRRIFAWLPMKGKETTYWLEHVWIVEGRVGYLNCHHHIRRGSKHGRCSLHGVYVDNCWRAVRVKEDW